MTMIVESPFYRNEKYCKDTTIFLARTDKSCKITESNELFRRMFAGKGPEPMGIYLYSLAGFNEVENFEVICQECLLGASRMMQVILAGTDEKEDKFLCVELSSAEGGLLCVGRDISDQHKRESEHLYQVRLLDQVSEAVISTDILFNIKTWNRAAETIYHYTAEEMIGRSALEAFNYTYTKGSTESAAAELMEHDRWQGEVSFVRHDDAAQIVLQASVTTVRDQQHAILGYVAVNREIRNTGALDIKSTTLFVDRDDRLDELEQSCQLLDTYVQISHEGLFIIDEQYRVRYVNNTAQSISKLAIGRELAMGDDLLSISHPSRKQVIADVMQRVFQGETVSYEAMYDFFKDGKLHWYAQTIIPIRNASGKVIYACCVSRDISPEKELQGQLHKREKQKRKELLSAVITAQEKERHRIAFELHENISQLLAMSKLYIQSNPSQDPKLQDRFKAAKDLISTAISELKQISYAIDPENIRLAGFIPSLEYLVQYFNNSRKVNISLHTGNYREQYFTHPDIELAIYRIIQDKLDNIMRYSNATTAQIILSKTEKDTVLNISDDGIGFDLNAIEQGSGIKNMFNRSELYNGTLIINTEPGEGCMLTLVIPNNA